MDGLKFTLRELFSFVTGAAIGLATFGIGIGNRGNEWCFAVLLTSPCLGAAVGSLTRTKATGFLMGCLISVGMILGLLLLPQIQPAWE